MDSFTSEALKKGAPEEAELVKYVAASLQTGGSDTVSARTLQDICYGC